MNSETATATQTAIEYGVCNHDTAKLLNWRVRTLFYWITHPEWQHWRFATNKEAKEFLQFSGDYIVIPAPQMHEIAPLFPRLITHEGLDYVFHAEYKQLLYACINYSHRLDSVFKTIIDEHHYAQAYAELYIKLREAGLLEKEVRYANN